MATAGKGVVIDTGKRGVLASGKAAVFNADGDCPECCGTCDYCKENTTPQTLNVTFTDVLPSAGCCLGMLQEYDWGAKWPGVESPVAYKWVEAPTGFEEMELMQQEGSPCQYDAVALPTTGKIACYKKGYWRDEVWIDYEDCENDEYRLGTLDVAFFYAYAQIGGGDDALVKLWCAFITPDNEERLMLEVVFGNAKEMFNAVTDLPNDEEVPNKILCLTEWDEDNVYAADDCTGLAYGGAVNVVPVALEESMFDGGFDF